MSYNDGMNNKVITTERPLVVKKVVGAALD